MYGELRGGTAAIKLKNSSNLYLSFFHSRLDRPNMRPSRYYMGAVTFRVTESVIVKIDSISPFPIVLNGTYTGTWAHPNIDFVLYPTGIAMDVKGDSIIVSACSQDKHSLAFKFKLKGLLRSLEPAIKYQFIFKR